jgi:3-hydroxyisobutyrate dehydrogenase-like beta-hydroxyacid dehydrogenase
MGAAILPHLVSGCSQVTVWNRTAAKSAQASTAGARVAQSPREAAENSDVILSILFDDEAVTDVYLGGDGLLSGECAGRVFVEMSTIAPATTGRVASAAQERSASFVDAPVSGTVGPAREGKLLVLAGGSDADLERVRPVLSLFARRVAHLGPVGSGISAKLSLQLPIYVYWQSLAEALCISVRAGLDMREMLDVIADSPAALAMLKSKIPTLLGQDEAVAFALSAAAKDLAIIHKTAAALGVSAPAASVALEGYRRAVQAGLGEADVAQIVRFLLERAGTLSN